MWVHLISGYTTCVINSNGMLLLFEKTYQVVWRRMTSTYLVSAEETLSTKTALFRFRWIKSVPWIDTTALIRTAAESRRRCRKPLGRIWHGLRRGVYRFIVKTNVFSVKCKIYKVGCSAIHHSADLFMSEQQQQPVLDSLNVGTAKRVCWQKGDHTDSR